MFRGKRKAPNLEERGQGVLKYERIKLGAKIVKINIPTIFLFFTSQFEIVKFRKGDDDKDLCVNGKCPYFRILIRKK